MNGPGPRNARFALPILQAGDLTRLLPERKQTLGFWQSGWCSLPLQAGFLFSRGNKHGR
jgi:hypothetical protein